MSDVNRRALLAKAHLAAKDLGLDADTRRAVQLQVTGVESCGEMGIAQLEKLLAHYRAKGWRPKPGRAAKAKKLASAPQAKMIRALWLTLADAGAVRSREENALRHYVKRNTGIGALEWLSVHDANRVIEGLKSWCARVGAEGGGQQTEGGGRGAEPEGET